MVGFLARIFIALTAALLLLIVMACALAAETVFDFIARRRLTTHLRRNRPFAVQSYQTGLEEAQS